MVCIMATKSLLLLFVVHCVHTKPDYSPPYGERLQPKPFKYQYSGGQQTGHTHTKKEFQDADGNVVGEVVVALPDGRIQTTNYNADFYDGYNAEIQYAGTASYPPIKYQDQTYNSPKFIPVHLKSKPKIQAVHQKPRKTIYNASPSYSTYQTRNRNKQILQPELKTVEIPVDAEGFDKQSEIVFEPEKIKPVIRPGKIRGKQEPEKISISVIGESIDMAEKLREELESSQKIQESEKLILSPIKPEEHRPVTLK